MIDILTPINIGGPYVLGKNTVNVLNKKGIKARQIKTKIKLLAYPLYTKADLVHSIDIPIAHHIWKKPLILNIQGEYPLQKNIWQRFYPKAIKKADIVTVPSKFIKERLKIKEAEVIPNAIISKDFNHIKYKDNNEINIVTLTKFAFLDKSLGVLNIIEPLKKAAKETDKKINYTIIGGGKFLDHIKTKIKPSFNIKFIGYHDNPKKILEKSDLFLYYSNRDTFAIAVIEAMASGLPVITNNYGPTHEIIKTKEDGYIAENQEEYTNHLINLINSVKLRKKIGQKAIQKVKETFDINKTTERYIEIYKSLIHNL